MSDPKPSNSIIPNTSLLSDIPACEEKIERILDEHVTLTQKYSYQRYLVQWRGRPDTYASWIPRAELQRLALELLQEYNQVQLDAQQDA